MSLTRRAFLKLSGAAVASLPFIRHAAAAGVNVPVLMYHDISHQQREEETVSPALFAAQMEWLYGAGYRAISFAELGSLTEEKAKRAVIITFDDGYASFMDYAYPLFTEYAFKSTINLIGSLQGGGEPLLSWDECRFLVQDGLVEIGCHTYDLHRWRGDLPRSEALASFNEHLPQDLARFQQVYARELGRRAKVLAWPYGIYDDTSIKIARQAGFDMILSSRHRYFGLNDSRADMLRCPCSEPLLRGEHDGARFSSVLHHDSPVRFPVLGRTRSGKRGPGERRSLREGDQCRERQERRSAAQKETG